MLVQKIRVKPLYKNENGVFVYRLDDDSVPVPFSVQYKALIYLPPGETGGNHKHTRQEAFLGSPHLDIAWLDEQNNLHRVPMIEDGTPVLFVVSPNVPHAVINTSTTEVATLFEFADDPILKSHPVEVVEK